MQTLKYYGSQTVDQQTCSQQGDGLTPKTIPVKLRVYAFTLPRTNHLKTAFDFYDHITKVRYAQGDKEANDAYQARIIDLNDQYIQEMLRSSSTPSSTLAISRKRTGLPFRHATVKGA